MSNIKTTKYTTIIINYSKAYDLHNNNPNWLKEIGACSISFTLPGRIATVLINDVKKFFVAKIKYGL